MSLFAHLAPLLTGLAVALLLATLAGRLLGRRAPADLNARILGWWIMLPVMVLCLFAGRAAVYLFFLAVSARILTELNPPRRPLLLLLLPAHYALLWFHAPPAWILLPLPLLALLLRDTAPLLGIYCLAHLPALLDLPLPRHGAALALVFLVCLTQTGDIFQFLWGRALGRHPIAPRLSPAKTVEGLLGGLLSSALLGALLHGYTPWPPLGAAAAAFGLTLTGFLGGLLSSALKRRRGLKDWGRLLPGHGGLLDRADSLLLSGPLFYHLLRLFAPD